MFTQKEYFFIGLGAIAIMVLILVFIYKQIFSKLIDDTLKRKDEQGILRWSRTSLTMFTAWVSVLFAFIIDTIKHDGDVNPTMFGIMVAVALGSKITDAWSKKLGQPAIVNSPDVTTQTVTTTTQ